MHSKEQFGAARNQRIALVRLLCIFGMIYVHVPELDTGYGFSTNGGFFQFEFVHAFLVEGYGRTSACLLSVVSGYLVALTLNSETSVRQFYLRRFRSIFVPMIVWGLVSVALFSVVSLSQPTFLDEVCGLNANMITSCINVVLHLTAMGDGPTMHLAFLRDLFVCMLLAPLLLVVLRNMPMVVLTVLVVIYIVDIESVLILRPLVILGFSVGIFIGLNSFSTTLVDRLWIVWMCLAIATTLMIIAFNNGQLQILQWYFAEHGLDAKESFLYPLSRLFGALTIWSLSVKLVSPRFIQLSRKLEPILFVVFCAHPLLLSIMKNLSMRVISHELSSELYPMWFLTAPAVAIATVFFATSTCTLTRPGRLMPSLIRVVTGGRGSSPATETQKDDLLVSTNTR